LQGQLKSLKKQPSEESQKKKLKKELLQKNFERAEKITELTVRFILMGFLGQHH
jgi:hypothetical protein